MITLLRRGTLFLDRQRDRADDLGNAAYPGPHSPGLVQSLFFSLQFGRAGPSLGWAAMSDSEKAAKPARVGRHSADRIVAVGAARLILTELQPADGTVNTAPEPDHEHVTGSA